MTPEIVKQKLAAYVQAATELEDALAAAKNAKLEVKLRYDCGISYEEQSYYESALGVKFTWDCEK